MERFHIVETLRKTNWVVGGRDGAAALLGLPRTTLISRMRKMGISRTLCSCPHRPSSCPEPVAKKAMYAAV
ncbi:MAG: helix-turn-helix domain-containing protein [Ignavibacteriota bacterium]